MTIASSLEALRPRYALAAKNTPFFRHPFPPPQQISESGFFTRHADAELFADVFPHFRSDLYLAPPPSCMIDGEP